MDHLVREKNKVAGMAAILDYNGFFFTSHFRGHGPFSENFLRGPANVSRDIANVYAGAG